MTGKVDQRIADMSEQVALPRKNGELVFVAPWEARAFGLPAPKGVLRTGDLS